jgi:hypothetical protein
VFQIKDFLFRLVEHSIEPRTAEPQNRRTEI